MVGDRRAPQGLVLRSTRKIFLLSFRQTKALQGSQALQVLVGWLSIPQCNYSHNLEALGRGGASPQPHYGSRTPSFLTGPLWPEGDGRTGADTGVKLSRAPSCKDGQPLPSVSISDTVLRDSVKEDAACPVLVLTLE